MLTKPALFDRLMKDCPILAATAFDSALPCIRLRTMRSNERDLPLGASKFGGNADLPRNLAWPVFDRIKDGKPLHFIAQLDLAVIGAAQVDPDMPRSGLLSFFYDAEEMPMGLSREDNSGWRVHYFPVGSNLERRAMPEKREPTLLPCAVTCQAGLSLPSWFGPAFDGLNIPDSQSDAFDKIRFELNSAAGKGANHQLLGFADPVQNPPEDSVEQAMADESIPAGAENEWRLLLQVDSDEALDIMWGDAGIIYYMIKKSDLREKRFEKTWLEFQCC